MMNKSEKFTKKDLRDFFLCLIPIFLVLVIPKMNFNNLIEQFNNLVSFNSVSYNSSNPPIFFSIGEAISALAILITVFIFIRKEFVLALRIRNYILPTVITLVVFGLFFSFYSSIFCFNIFKIPTNIFQLSLFWQIISGTCILLAILFLLLKTNNNNLFSRGNARKFYETLHWELAKPSEENLNLILKTLLANFENICKSVSDADFGAENNKYARSILNVILGEGSMVKLLSTKRLDGLLYVIGVIKKYHISDRYSPLGLPMIFRGLFFDSDSFLYKQLDNSGLALSANLYDSLFGSSELLTNFDLFGYPTIGYSAKNSTGSVTVNVFIQSVSKSIETYLKTGEVPARNINNGIKHLSDIFGELCSKMSAEKSTKTKYGLKEEWWSLHKIATFLSRDYAYLGKPKEFNTRVVAIEKTAQEADFFSNLAVNEGIAAALYMAFTQLSQIEKGDDTYSLVLNLLEGIIYTPTLKEGYIVPFEKRIWEQIGANVFGRYYPVVLKTYLNYVGFCLVGGEGQRQGWAGEQAERMRRLLYVDLKPLLDKDEKMIDGTPMVMALLPDCMHYKKERFTYVMGFGRGPEEEIIPPPEGSKSALENVNWKNSKSLI